MSNSFYQSGYQSSLNSLSGAQLKLFSAAQTKSVDRIAIDEMGLPGYELMCRAGESACALLKRQWPAIERVVLVCGSGNNGGDDGPA